MFGKKNWWCVYHDYIGLIATPLTYALAAFEFYCTSYWVIQPMYGLSSMGIILQCVLCSLVFMVVWSGIQTTTTEPGCVLHNRTPGEEERKFYIETRSTCYCEKCDRMKPFRAHHCSKCRTCILKMDHHCPWVNNCIGARNQKFFILYLLYVHISETFVTILGAGCIWLHRFELKMNTSILHLSEIFPTTPFLQNWIGDHIPVPCVDDSVRYLLVIALVVLSAILFAVFSFFLFVDQMKAIRYDLSYVEYLKQYRVKTLENSFYDCLISTMGEPFCMRWFIPVEGKYLNLVIGRLSKEFLSFDPYDPSDNKNEEEKKNQ